MEVEEEVAPHQVVRHQAVREAAVREGAVRVLAHLVQVHPLADLEARHRLDQAVEQAHHAPSAEDTMEEAHRHHTSPELLEEV